MAYLNSNQPVNKQDSLVNGALIGMGIHAGIYGAQEAYYRKTQGKSLTQATTDSMKAGGFNNWSNNRSRGLALAGSAAWAGIGAGVDWII